jgi:hypothetical protein
MHRGFPNHPEHEMTVPSWIKWALLGLVLFATGCLQPDPNGSDANAQGKPLQDVNLLAGATSSTNWPPDDAGTIKVTVTGEADTSLVLRFQFLFEKQMLSGRVRLFQAGGIPPLDSMPELRVPFQNADSVTINPSQIREFLGNSQDTVQLALRIESDSGNCFFFGFVYVKREHVFIHSPFSILSSSSAEMYPDSSYLNAVMDTSTKNSDPEPNRNTDICFYIPGTPYFWKVGMDSTISLGPIPKGKYPVRLLRITYPESAQGTNRLETFEAIITEIGTDPITNHARFRISLGEMLDSTSFMGTVTLRAP